MPLTFEQAYEQRDSYRPTDTSALAQLGNSDLLCFVGASAAGKDYLMSRTGGNKVRSSTTRAPRSGDEVTAHYSVDEALQLIDEGKVLQYAPIKELGDIYFTMPDDFKPGLNVKDVNYDGSVTFEDRGLRRVQTVGVLALADEYGPRLAERLQAMDPSKIHGRLAHAAITTRAIIDWCQSDEKLVLVSTQRRDVDNQHAIKQFIETGKADLRDNQAALVIGTKMLHTIQRMDAWYGAQGNSDATRLLV